MNIRPKEILERYDAWERRTDVCDFQWKLRLLQSHWRVQRDLPNAFHHGKRRGAELAMPEAQQTLVNYLTPTIRTVVRREVDGRDRSQGKLFKEPRIYNHLLSSQPLSFNLFGELAEDHELASCVLREMTGGRLARVTAIKFEWSPGRSNERYTNDGSAFDVYVKYEGPAGEPGFLGIEVKYHENLKSSTKDYRLRYDEVAAEMGCFREASLPTLRQAGPLQQMWRDHLLSGSHRKSDGFADACFVMVYPELNTACSRAIDAYKGCLRSSDTFDAWTLENFVTCLAQHTEAEWVGLFRDRYLDLSRLPL